MTYTVFILDKDHNGESEVWYKNGSKSLMYLVHLISKYPPMRLEHSYKSMITYQNVLDFMNEHGFTKCSQIDNAYLLKAYEHVHVLSFERDGTLDSIRNITSEEIYDD